jgi:hypothetical protein
MVSIHHIMIQPFRRPTHAFGAFLPYLVHNDEASERWKLAFRNQGFTDFDGIGAIHCENSDGDPSHGG